MICWSMISSVWQQLIWPIWGLSGGLSGFSLLTQLFLARSIRAFSDYLASYGLNVWVLPKIHVLKS